MKGMGFRTILVFIAGMLTFGAGYFLYTTFINPERPEPGGIIENWSTICFQPVETGGMYVSVSPEGCYSSSCTRQVQKVGTAMVDERGYKIRIETRFVLAETSRFPLPCIENCSGGGTLDFKLDALDVGDYEVWFKDEQVGELMIFSGRPTPQQCFENTSG